MTLEEVDMMQTIVDDEICISTALHDTLVQAKEQNRITCGVMDTVKRMEANTDNIMMCVMTSEAVSDATMQIHFTLMEAFCWENEVRLIKVDSCAKLTKLMGSTKQPLLDANGNQRIFKTDDFTCLLIEYPNGELSAAEESVLDYYKILCNISPHPIVSLPA